MPFCPDCGTEVSEDTRFCPECGRPLAIGEAVKGKSKKKTAGIIVGCIIAIIVVVVIATRPPTSLEPEPRIPAHFTTYTDELGLFSISYPPEWELNLGVIEEREQAIRDVISCIDLDLPVENVSLLFIAGVPTIIGNSPNVNIVVEPCPLIVCTHDAVVNAEVEAAKMIVTDFQELSRVRTTVDGRRATILVSQGTFPYTPTQHYVQMICLVGRTVWVVTCGALPDEYSEWADDFDAIVRSLRVLK